MTKKTRTRYNLRKFFFANRVVNMCYNLPNGVAHAESTNVFKTKLDKFWSNQEIICDFYGEIQGTRSLSVIILLIIVSKLLYFLEH